MEFYFLQPWRLNSADSVSGAGLLALSKMAPVAATSHGKRGEVGPKSFSGPRALWRQHHHNTAFTCWTVSITQGLSPTWILQEHIRSEDCRFQRSPLSKPSEVAFYWALGSPLCVREQGRFVGDAEIFLRPPGVSVVDSQGKCAPVWVSLCTPLLCTPADLITHHKTEQKDSHNSFLQRKGIQLRHSWSDPLLNP